MTAKWSADDVVEEVVEREQPRDKDDWSKCELVHEVIEQEGKRYKVTKQVRTVDVRRPFSMVDHRATWKKFGDAAGQPKNDRVDNDPVVVLELNIVDPLEKACRDEVHRMWGDVERMSVNVSDPLLARYKETLTAAPVVTSTAPTTESTTKKTWAEASKERKESAAGDRAKDSGEKLTKNVVRISNLSDFITENELWRLFGSENGLPKIEKVFIAVDKATGQRRGFAYITYKTEKDGDIVVSKMSRTAFKNTILKVDFGTANTKK